MENQYPPVIAKSLEVIKRFEENSVGSVSGSTSFRKLTDSVLSLNRYRERYYATELSGGICGRESEVQTNFY